MTADDDTRSRTTRAAEEVVSGFYAGGSRHAGELARSTPSCRHASEPVTARARISAAKTKRTKHTRAVPMAPTPERLAKGDIAITGGFHRSVPPIERLRDARKLDPSASVNQAMYDASQKLQRHFTGCLVGIKAQDLSRVIASGTADGLEGEENWVHHFDQFRRACKIMGWFETNPLRGAGRLVVAVVCYEEAVTDAAQAYIGSGRKEVVMAAGMDRLREGLFALAAFWRLY